MSSAVRSIERRIFVRRQSDRQTPTEAGKPRLLVEHIEWGGIWAGYAVSIGLAVLLTFLVLAIGLTSVNPMDVRSWISVAGGAAVWSAIVVLISIFIGAIVAGRTPASSRQYGVLRGVTLWGLLMLTAVIGFAWLATRMAPMAAQMAREMPSVGAGTLPAPQMLHSNVESALLSNNIRLSNGQIDDIAARLNAGDRVDASSTLANAAHISTNRADAILNQVAPPTTTTSQLQPAGPQQLARGAATSAKTAAWAGFWMALLMLCVSVVGGAIGGGALKNLNGARGRA
jgi:hypothetical protein